MLVPTLPNGIALLSACLKEAGHKVKLFDSTFYKTELKSNDEIRMERLHIKSFDTKQFLKHLKSNDVIKEFDSVIKNFHPDLLAISLLDDTKHLGYELIFSIKNQDIPVIAGGIYSTFNANKLLDDNLVNYVCRGEGEQSIVRVADLLEKDKSVKNVGGISWKSGYKNIHNTISAPVDIDTLPFEDFTIFEPNRFQKPMEGDFSFTIPINMDRGCPFNCRFCAAPAIKKLYSGHKYFRKKSIGRIRKELQFQLSIFPKTSMIYFNSESFLSRSLKELEAFKNMYKEFDLPFWCQLSLNTVTKQKIEILSQMPIKKISVGIECGNEDFRKKMFNKHFSNKAISEAFRFFNEYHIDVGINNIIGSPDETRELVFDTIKLNKKLKFDTVNGFVFQPYSGTELRKYCIEKKYINRGAQTNSIIGTSILNMPQFSQDEIKGLLETFVLYIKLPENRWQEIRNAERDSMLLKELREEIE